MADFLRGAKPTPRHKLQASMPYQGFAPVAEEFAVIPPQLSMWGNSQYGDCVSAEEAFAKAAWSVMCGLPETFITEHDVIAWATKYGFRDGAFLPEVMDAMKVHGMPAGGQVYTDGGYVGVDYSNESLLRSAINQGPVKIGIDASALPSGAGNNQGWHAFGGSPGQFSNEDHCTALCGYGTAAYCFGQLGVPVPSGVDPTKSDCYLHFTWNTIGVVDYAWIMSTVQEAWLRIPTTVGQGPTPTPPIPPVPVPPSPPAPPSPPVPPVPPVPVVVSHGTVSIPAQTVHSGLFGHITIPGQNVPVTVSSGSSAPVGTPNYLALLNDVMSLIQTPEFKKVITDLGM